MNEDDAPDISQLVRDYMENRIEMEKLRTESYQIRRSIYDYKKNSGREENQEFKLQEGEVLLKKYVSKYSSILKKDFNKLSNTEKRELYKTGLLDVRFRLNYKKYQKLKDENKLTSLDKYVFKRDDNFPYYLNVKFNDEIKDDIRKFRKELEFLTAEDKLELEELRGDPDETPDIYDNIVSDLVDDDVDDLSEVEKQELGISDNDRREDYYPIDDEDEGK
jgi:hypothetical protein|tara:strand:- start:115 stop:774 length:660 start_codon:yes stop_codon:yes gene_type:complete